MACGTKFSEAIISSVRCWRSSSCAMASAISGSTSASGRLKKSGLRSDMGAPRRLADCAQALRLIRCVASRWSVPPTRQSRRPDGSTPRRDSIVRRSAPTRRAWRPPSKSVRRKARTIASASLGPSRAPDSVTMLTSLWRRDISASRRVVRVDGAHARDLVGDDRDADARAARQDGALGVALADQARRVGREARVVDGPRRSGADVDDVVARRGQRQLDVLLEVEPGVVRPDGDPHGCLSSSNPSSMVLTGA